MFKKIDHIGIAVTSLEAATEKYRLLVGKEPAHQELVEAQKVKTSFWELGESRLELLEGTEPASPISKFVEKRGAGVHHICFEVEDIAAAKEAFTTAGLQFIDLASDKGAHGAKVAFLHPKSTGGVLFELVEYPKK